MVKTLAYTPLFTHVLLGEMLPFAPEKKELCSGALIQGEKGSYRLGERISGPQQPYNTVYEARRVSDEAPCALKVVNSGRHEDELARLLVRELRVAQHLEGSRGIVPISDVGVDCPAIVMPYMDGGSLVPYKGAGPKLPLRNLMGMTAMLAAYLDNVHEKGIVHRDIKPDNILLNQDARVALLDPTIGFETLRYSLHNGMGITDFGIAETYGLLSQSLTFPHSLISTPEFAAPEQLRGERADPPADSFSLVKTVEPLLTEPEDDETFAKLVDFMEFVYMKGTANDPRQRPSMSDIEQICLEAADRLAA